MTDDVDRKPDVDQTVGRTAGRIGKTLERLMGTTSPATVFSEPVVVGDAVVITAAAWERGGGFGFGAGRGTDQTGGEGGGGGGGGGGSSQGRPVAVIRVGPAGIEVRPILDLTKIGVTVVLAAVGVCRAWRRGR